MIASAILRTVSVQMPTLSCHSRWSARLAAEERKFSNEGFSTSSRSLLDRALRAGIEILCEKGAKIEFVERIRRLLFGNFFRFFLQERFVGIAVGRDVSLASFFETGWP